MDIIEADLDQPLSWQHMIEDVLIPGPATKVKIDFFVQSFGPLNEMDMVGDGLLHSSA